MIGWLATKARHVKSAPILSKNGVSWISRTGAARQRISAEAHWRSECGKLLNNGRVACAVLATSLEADLREVTARLERLRQHAEDKIRQMISSEQRFKRAV